MRTALIFLLLPLAALAQEKTPTTAAPSACGPDNVKFEVKLDKLQHTPAQPEPGKALIYFIQDKGPQSCGIGAAPQTGIGMDGAWVGANRNNSYFSVSAELGKHHVCSAVMSFINQTTELAHFTAETGGKGLLLPCSSDLRANRIVLLLDPVDSDQAKYLIASYPLNVSHPKK